MSLCSHQRVWTEGETPSSAVILRLGPAGRPSCQQRIGKVPPVLVQSELKEPLISKNTGPGGFGFARLWIQLELNVSIQKVRFPTDIYRHRYVTFNKPVLSCPGETSSSTGRHVNNSTASGSRHSREGRGTRVQLISPGAEGPPAPLAPDANASCNMLNISARKCCARCAYDESPAPGQQAHAEK